MLSSAHGHLSEELLEDRALIPLAFFFNLSMPSHHKWSGIGSNTISCFLLSKLEGQAKGLGQGIQQQQGQLIQGSYSSSTEVRKEERKKGRQPAGRSQLLYSSHLGPHCSQEDSEELTTWPGLGCRLIEGSRAVGMEKCGLYSGT